MGVLQNRWKERDRELLTKIQTSQQEMHSRGMLHSSIAVKALHEVFANEFRESRATIVRSVIDSLNQGEVSFKREMLEKWAVEQLSERQQYLDSLFKEKSSISARGIANLTLIEPYQDVAQYLENSSQELAIELGSVLDDYQTRFGATLYDRTLNNFKNQPLVVIDKMMFEHRPQISGDLCIWHFLLALHD